MWTLLRHSVCPTSPARFRTSNWCSYTAALKKRGALVVWLDKEMTWRAPQNGSPLCPPRTSRAHSASHSIASGTGMAFFAQLARKVRDALRNKVNPAVRWLLVQHIEQVLNGEHLCLASAQAFRDALYLPQPACRGLRTRASAAGSHPRGTSSGASWTHPCRHTLPAICRMSRC